MRRMETLNRLSTVTACLEAVSDLMNPERDLHAVNRDNLAILLSFLSEEFRAASDELSRVPQGKAGRPALHPV
jgi:hypothetical protein